MQEKQGQSGVEHGPTPAGASSHPLSQHPFAVATCSNVLAVEVSPLRVKSVTTSKMPATMRKGRNFTPTLYVFFLYIVKGFRAGLRTVIQNVRTT